MYDLEPEAKLGAHSDPTISTPNLAISFTIILRSITQLTILHLAEFCVGNMNVFATQAPGGGWGWLVGTLVVVLIKNAGHHGLTYRRGVATGKHSTHVPWIKLSFSRRDMGALAVYFPCQKPVNFHFFSLCTVIISAEF